MDSLASLADADGATVAVGWTCTFVLVVAALWSLVAGAYLWGGFVAVVVAAVLLPPATRRDWTATVPWPHLLLATGAVVARTLGLAVELAGYLAIAALAILAVVELSSFSPVQMTHRFAVVFGVLATLALQGWLTIARYYSDRWLGTDFLATQTELQWDFVAVSIVALAFGIASEWYLARAETDGAAVRGAAG